MVCLLVMHAPVTLKDLLPKQNFITRSHVRSTFTKLDTDKVIPSVHIGQMGFRDRGLGSRVYGIGFRDEGLK